MKITREVTELIGLVQMKTSIILLLVKGVVKRGRVDSKPKDRTGSRKQTRDM